MTPEDQEAFNLIYGTLRSTRNPEGSFSANFPTLPPTNDALLMPLFERAYYSYLGINFYEHWVREFRAIAYLYDFDISLFPELAPVYDTFRKDYSRGTARSTLMPANRKKRKATMTI